ncbi:hypothetical protein H920_14726 [Fukomys damarensis]|uniref:EKC/KEOPS complex subunit LAGE3 n=1 Tax=Fukomys damarensis TaxID=885580 RepID=A0A091D057_FUKDA|nr:hypothetical protein H920_14726 [Fukomys damarensis]
MALFPVVDRGSGYLLALKRLRCYQLSARYIAWAPIHRRKKSHAFSHPEASIETRKFSLGTNSLQEERWVRGRCWTLSLSERGGTNMQGPDNVEGGPHGDDGDNREGGGRVHPIFMEGGEGLGVEGVYGGEHLQGQGAVQGPGAGGDASAAAGVNEEELLDLRLTMPFRCSVDTELAYWLLDPVAATLQEGVRREMTIDGNELNIRLTSDNSHLQEFDIAVWELLQQVSMVLRVFENLET